MSPPTNPKAHSVFIRLTLAPYTLHFKSPNYMEQRVLEILDKTVSKKTLKSTSSSTTVRLAIGSDPQFWEEFCLLLRSAVPSLERRSFTIWDPTGVDYESTSGALIAGHYPHLWRDLERVNDLVSISRNCLTCGEAIQDLAARHGLEGEMFRLVNCCVRVTARGYDGDAGTGDEEKWQWIVNAYKKLLITSLQFLNNLVAQNERRKLLLWLNLFDHGPADQGYLPEDVPETSAASKTDVPSNPTREPELPLTEDDLFVAFGTDGEREVDLEGAEPLWDHTPFEAYPLPKEAIDGREKMQGNGYALYAKRTFVNVSEDYNMERGREPTLGEMHLDMPRRWAEQNEDDHAYWQGQYEDAMAKYRQDSAVWEAKNLAAMEEEREQLKDEDLPPPELPNDGPLTIDNALLMSRSVVPDDMRMLFTAEAGAKILESGKAELMKRLEGYEHPPPQPQIHPQLETQLPDAEGGSERYAHPDVDENPIERTASASRTPPPPEQQQPPPLAETALPLPQEKPSKTGPIDLSQEDDEEEEQDEEGEEEEEDEDESEEEADEDEEEDYPGSTEDGRGLLTDVPLILGPSEIEVLPMLIMSGMVPPTNFSEDLSIAEKNAIQNLHMVRTHILLSQSNGRNLLRELLIFVAAWDLREEELYFKFMVKIMEAILKNGLMPYAYHAFRDRSRSKDIISPAQAVIMKLLTCIFRARGEAAKAAVAANAQNKTGPPPQPVSVVGGPVSIAINPEDRPIIKLPYMPSRSDLHILNFIFTEFRQHIIPQTCALIFLQGQIHAGRASPEDFPLNLWDMERMYEGVYQYLEFFAVLTEELVWKGVLGEWEMASELVTLLRELEGGIPKMGAVVPQMPKRVEKPALQRAQSADAIQHRTNTPAPPPPVQPSTPQPAPVAVERPFDVDPTPSLGADAKLPPLPVHPPASANQAPIFEAETPLAYPSDADPNAAAPPTTLPSLGAHDQDEPSDFEWRNLKKLTVLVLSSLIWKNRTVQDQVRKSGGLEALIGCCRNDDHNPYIREHAIMCLRFGVEGNEENAARIRDMAGKQKEKWQKTLKEKEARDAANPDAGPATPVTTPWTKLEDVPKEVLDTSGYETFMDPKGQVGLRRKEAVAHAPAPPSGSSSKITDAGISKSSSGPAPPRLSSTKLTAERAAELMSSALSSLPLGGARGVEKGVLEKLDRAFEGSGASGSGKK